MIEALLTLTPQSRNRLAHGLACGALDLKPTRVALRSVAGITEEAGAVLDALAGLGARGMDSVGVSVLLETLSQAENRERKPDLVWSGPEAPGVHVRGTRQVYEELVQGAERSLWLSSYAYFDGPQAFATLARRMALSPTLQVRLLLNIERPYGDTSEADALVARFAHRFWSRDWPGESQPEVYYARSSVAQDGQRGALHAKTIVVDDERLFVTSANLTEAAFGRNIEAGVLLHDRVLALSAVRHFDGLIENRLLVRLPGAE